MKVIEKVRYYKPDIAISGDFIIGFPGETDKDHQATMELISEIKYSQAYSFKYSVRPGTPAGTFNDHIDENLKKSRLQEVQELLRVQQMQFNEKFVNSTLQVLVLRNGKKNGQYLGKTPYNQSIYFNSEYKDLIGSIVTIVVTDAFQNSLTGIIKDIKSI